MEKSATRPVIDEPSPLPLVVEEAPESGTGNLRAEELRLQFVAAELAAALDRTGRAVEALHSTSLASRARDLFDSLESLQEDAARELGRRVGERIADEHRWSVRAGIELVDP